MFTSVQVQYSHSSASTLANGFAAAPAAAESAQQMLDLADAYESSQPSYAADLRAAAAPETLQ